MSVPYLRIPGDSPFADAKDAMAYLRIGNTTTFLRLIGRKKGGVQLPGVRDWLHTTYIGGTPMWLWEDIYALGRILAGRRHTAEEEIDEEN